jgi:hypothetical protein
MSNLATKRFDFGDVRVHGRVARDTPRRPGDSGAPCRYRRMDMGPCQRSAALVAGSLQDLRARSAKLPGNNRQLPFRHSSRRPSAGPGRPGRDLRTQCSYDIAFRIVRPDRTERIIHAQGESTLNQAGKVVRLTGTAHDITEREEAERLARDELQRTQMQLEIIGRIGQSEALMSGDIEAIAAKSPNWRRSPPVASASMSGCSTTPRPSFAASTFTRRRLPVTRPA